MMYILFFTLALISAYMICGITYISIYGARDIEKFYEFEHGIFTTYVVLFLYVWVILNIMQFIKTMNI